MSDFDALFESIGPIAGRMQDLQRQAAQQYKPVVDDILHSGCREAKVIEHTLDRLLDFCRHYWDIDPAATADYIKVYREQWLRDEHEIQA